MAKSTGIERSKKNPIELEHNNTLLQKNDYFKTLKGRRVFVISIADV
jgi:hypothetical protein